MRVHAGPAGRSAERMREALLRYTRSGCDGEHGDMPIPEAPWLSSGCHFRSVRPELRKRGRGFAGSTLQRPVWCANMHILYVLPGKVHACIPLCPTLRDRCGVMDIASSCTCTAQRGYVCMHRLCVSMHCASGCVYPSVVHLHESLLMPASALCMLACVCAVYF